MSPFQQHCQKWSDGCGNEMCLAAVKRCFARGDIPCDVLFVGEAPGDCEDREGSPFVGRAGILLQEKVVNVAVPKGVRTGFMNLVACMPKDDTGRKTGAPSNEEVLNCKDRFLEMYHLMSPRLVVAVGSEAAGWLDYRSFHRIDIGTVPLVHIVHPSNILRAQVYLQSDMIRDCVITVAQACMEYLR